MPARPRLRPDHRPLRRGPDSVQLGPSSGVVLDGLTPADHSVLLLLDGTRTRAQLHASAAALGAPPDRVDDLLAVLEQIHALERPADARLLAWRRRRTRVLVGGPAPLAEAVAAALRAAEVGSVSCGDWALDDLDLALRSADRPAPPPPDLVVLCGLVGVHPSRADPWLRQGVVHLPVVVDGPDVTIGPLVTPPLIGSDPCLRCVELHRGDRDPARATVLAQCAEPWSGQPISWDATAGAVLGAAGALVALVVAAHLAGQPLPGGISVELVRPWPQLRHRRWRRHPRCGGHADAPGEPGAEKRVTMAG